ncbi:MAG: GHKL domain-containing protein [Erysipelotrichaceae bacterium]|nr:GHKL domain-containing protein [Erysipelotrichaceae bacterium]
MISFNDLVGFLVDTLFAYMVLKRTEGKDDIPDSRKMISLLFLAMTIILYSINLFSAVPVSELRNLIRLLLRILLYYLFVRTYRGSSAMVSLFYSSFCASLYTLCHNIFLTPLTRSFLMATHAFTGIHFLDVFLCILIVYGTKILIYYLVFRFVPFDYVVDVDLISFFTLIIVMMISVFIKSVQQSLGEIISLSSLHLQISIYFIILQITLIAFLIIFEHYRSKVHENLILSIQDINTKAILENTRQNFENEESLRSFRHDVKNHITAVSVLLENHDIDAAREYLHEIDEGLQDVNRIYNTGNHLLDGLLKQKSDLAERKDISFEVNVDFRKGDFISPYDLCTIISNILDNAIEANEKIEDKENRFIRVRGSESAGQLILGIENPDPKDNESELLSTTKKDHKLHGYGLKNVKKAVRKYNGELNIFRENSNFILTIIIPLPE